MNVERAEKLLGISRGATPAEVRRAFAAAAMVDHPDRGGKGLYVEELRGARNALLRYAGAATNEVCPMCKNTGYTGMGFASVPCVRGCKAS